MSQYDFGNLESPVSGTALVNTHLEPWRDALHTMHSGSSRPSYAVAGTLWRDTSGTPWLLKLYDGADDITLGSINATTNVFTLLAGAATISGAASATSLALTDALNTAQGANIASASTINLDTATGNVVDVTGTTAITAVTLSQGRFRIVRFTGALTLTNGANLVLPTGANITTAAGDYALFVGYASSVVRCVYYSRANGTAVGGGQSKIVNTTRDVSLASSTQSVTGAGFTPKGVDIYQTQSTEAGRFSLGFYDGTTQWCIYRNVATGNFGTTASYTVVVQDAAGATQYLGSVSLTSDGCDIAWTKVGSPTGTVAFGVKFWR